MDGASGVNRQLKGDKKEQNKDDGGTSYAKPKPEGVIDELNKACIEDHQDINITKIGPWGGKGGSYKDITEESVCLHSIIIRCGETIQSIAFTYSDKYGKQHFAGPWGAVGKVLHGSFHTIQLGPSEFLIKVSGTIGMSNQHYCDVVSSLVFTTNARSYGPFGKIARSPFCSPPISNGSIVGFFCQAMGLIDAIGVYVNPAREPVEKRSLITKVGPWGSGSGRSCDVDVLPQRLISVVVRSGRAIESLEFTYKDCDGQQHIAHIAGSLGGSYASTSPNGSFHTIQLGPSEFLIKVSGTIGLSSDNSIDVVTSLMFTTNARWYGPFGKGEGTSFDSPLMSTGSIVGFFGRATRMVDAIGLYVNSGRETIFEKQVEGGIGMANDMANTVTHKSWDSRSHRLIDASKDRIDMKSTRTILDHILDGSAQPTNVPLALLQDITEDFSDKRKIGSGGFGVVYKGVLQNRSIAIKKLLNSQTIEDKPFYNEADFLMNVKHKNIVRFLGFCAHTENTSFKVGGSGRYDKYIYPEIRERLLCFEYISKGSLDNYLNDELRGLEWHTRYEIIRGICDGMQYLHKEKDIVHMDLKPANILLDDLMVPKITDFGISRQLDGISRALTKQCLISIGYCAPEYLRRGEISFKSDIYSLGVIITDLVTGRKGDPDIKNVLRRWRYRWNKSAMCPPFGYKQVTKCIEIALSCMSESPKGRPYIWDIVSMLSAMDSTNENISNINVPTVGPISPYPWELLEFDPLELHFPFEVNKQIPCSLQLTNERDDYIAFDVQITSTLKYSIEPNKGIVPPRSKHNVIITLQPREKAPHDMLCKDVFDVRCTIVNEGFTAENITEDMFDAKNGKVIDEVNLTVCFLPRT